MPAAMIRAAPATNLEVSIGKSNKKLGGWPRAGLACSSRSARHSCALSVQCRGQHLEDSRLDWTWVVWGAGCRCVVTINVSVSVAPSPSRLNTELTATTAPNPTSLLVHLEDAMRTPGLGSEMEASKTAPARTPRSRGPVQCAWSCTQG
ncbi:hypothetical protein B0T18DRAFT_249279 [Schizothecium vesticola]|uniref:Uncharacterized protein n=1 Tax=Schizothecium vesticola TaxID=314040 RepID=A0AA40EG08_9PEZI|nr:hypothetical protein B0T18DRAFT_249279 [Schizothecium vesticola]